MGDACEMLVAAEITLNGVPCIKAPQNWPGYDLIAQPQDGAPLRISVKSRHYKRGAAFFSYREADDFEWLAIVILRRDSEPRRQFFLVPRAVADQRARRDGPGVKNPRERYWRIDRVAEALKDYRDNFSLDPKGNSDGS